MNQQTTFPNDVIFLVSYPKSGSTWLRFLIGNYLTNGQCDFTNYHQIVPDIHYNPEQLEKISDGPIIKFIKSHWPFTPDSKKVIYIVRDGRDVALSYYFHFLRKGKQATWFFKEFLELFNTTSTLDKFTLWSHHVNEWLDNAPKDFMLVRYEDMQTNTNAELIRVLEFADIPVNQQTVTTAVEAAQFKRMQQLEKQQRSFDPTLAGSAPNQYAVRSGKVGESKSYFSDELMAQFIEVHGSALERLGYLQKKATMLTQLSAEKGSQKSLSILCESEKSGGDSSPKKIEGNLDLNNIVLTGIPRSGTTLTCYLLNKLPNTVALNEPIAYRHIEPLSNYQEMCAYICRFFEQMRDSIYHHKIAESKTVNGKITDNMASEQFGKGSTTREWVASSEDKKFFIEKELTKDFLLIIKKPVIFTMVLEQLIQYFPVYAIIRNPLSVLASWSNVPLDIREGRSPAEKWDTMLARNLAQQPDQIARQLYLLSWYYEKYHRYLPTNAILRYEDIIAFGGQTLSMITPKASQLNESLENKNLNQLYDRELMLVLGERLLKSEGAFWEFYTKESVKLLLDVCEISKSHHATFTPNKEINVEEPTIQSLMIHQIVTQLNAKNNADALALVEKAIIAQPNLIGLHYGKALVLARLGYTEKAIETLKQLLIVMPTHQLGRRLLSNLPKN